MSNGQDSRRRNNVVLHPNFWVGQAAKDLRDAKSSDTKTTDGPPTVDPKDEPKDDHKIIHIIITHAAAASLGTIASEIWRLIR